MTIRSFAALTALGIACTAVVADTPASQPGQTARFEPTAAPLFREEFEAATLDPSRWQVVGGSHALLIEHSGKQLLRLGPGASLLSLPLDLTCSSGVKLWLSTRSLDAGVLTIEARTAAGAWQPLLVLSPTDGQLRDTVADVPTELRAPDVTLRVSTDPGKGAWELARIEIVAGDHAVILLTLPDAAIPLEAEAPGGPSREVHGHGAVAFPHDATVRLAAPRHWAGLRFERWYLNGAAAASDETIVQQQLASDLTAIAAYLRLGDMNGDGALDEADLDAFVLAVTAPQQYQAQYPALDRLRRGDLNQDGIMDQLDVAPFVDLFVEP